MVEQRFRIETEMVDRVRRLHAAVGDVERVVFMGYQGRELDAKSFQFCGSE